jgi:hypothetical protein
MKRLLVWVSLIATVLPLIAVILMGFGTPERNLFGIIASAYGLVALGVVLMTNQGVKRRNRGVLAMFIIGFWLIGFVSLCSFWMVWDQCVFHSPSRSLVFFPLWLNERAKEKIESAGGRKAYYERYGAGAVSTLLEDQTIN